VIAVVTTVRDGERALAGLADALDAQTLSDFEWVVIDNASRDGTARVARARGATVVAEPQPGRARARNRGVAATGAQLLAFTDADCRPRPDWLKRPTERLARGEPLVAGRVLVTTSVAPNAIERFEALWRFRDDPQRGWAPTANLGMRREAFEAIGGFDPSYRHIGEDVDLCLRAGAAGFSLTRCPDAIVEHAAETERRPVLRRSFEQAYALHDLHRKHGLQAGRYWRNPGPLIRGDWALRRFGIDPAQIPSDERRAILRVARSEYAARIAGSLWAPMRTRGQSLRSHHAKKGTDPFFAPCE
jgi:GT2 family glycosyltransferase